MKRKLLSLVLALLIAVSIVPIIPAKKVEAAGGKLIAITYDDGPGRYTGMLLDGLAARGVKATFFMNGVNGTNGVVSHRDIVNRMVSEGHQVANHTYSHHVPFSRLSGGQMQSEVAGVGSILDSARNGSYRTLVRIPGGENTAGIRANVAAPMITWDVDSLDWKYRNSDSVYSKIMSSARDGSIILAHDLYPTSVEGTLRAISALQAQGYEFVTVSELFRRRGVSLSNGSVYTCARNNGINLPAYSAPTITQKIDEDGDVYATISAPASGMTLRYTTDGSTPGLSSSVYSGQVLRFDKTTTIKVIGIDSFCTKTPVVTATIGAGYRGAFNARYYADANPDLKAKFGYNVELLAYHYEHYGIKEGRQASPVFNINYYRDRYPDVKRAYGNDNEKVVRHFVNYGMKEARQGSALFNPESYRLQYVDLRRAYGMDYPKYYTHFIKYGYKEGRKGTGCKKLQHPMTVLNGVNYGKIYDYFFYTNKYPDVKKYAGTDDLKALKHFVNYGMSEGRQGKGTFDIISYRNANSDLRNSFGHDNKKYYTHYLNYGYKEKRKASGVTEAVNPTSKLNGVDYSGIYDYKYYITKSPDVRKAYQGDDEMVIKHFVAYGMKEGRTASPVFNYNYYKKMNPDLAKSFGSDKTKYYMHFLNYGMKEGRRGSSEFNIATYIIMNPDLRRAYGKDFKKYYLHYIKYGSKEGRPAKGNHTLEEAKKLLK